MEQLIDHYSTLGIEPCANAEQIKKAWRRIARDTHPDIHGEDEIRTERFKKAQKAYTLLSDPEKRSRYDLMRHVESNRRSCLTCGRPVYDNHNLCRFCRIAAEKERKRQKWQRQQAKLRRAKATARARDKAEQHRKAEQHKRDAARNRDIHAQQRIEREFGVFGNDVSMGSASSDELLQSLLAESAIQRADRRYRPNVEFSGDGVIVNLQPGVKIKVDRNTLDKIRQVHRNLTTADKIIRQVRRWF